MATERELSDFLKSVETRAFKRSVYHVRDEEAALDIVQDSMRNTPRMRAWMFSSVVSSGRPLNSLASEALKASNSGTMEISS